MFNVRVLISVVRNGVGMPVEIEFKAAKVIIGGAGIPPSLLAKISNIAVRDIAKTLETELGKGLYVEYIGNELKGSSK